MLPIYATLLHNVAEFQGFVEFVGAKADDKVRIAELVREEFKGKICEHADVAGIIAQQPTELAFAFALIDTTDYRSVTPSWVLHNFPKRCKQTLFHGMKEGTRYHFHYPIHRCLASQRCSKRRKRARSIVVGFIFD